MSILINKVGKIDLGKKWASGEMIKLSTSKRDFVTDDRTLSAYYLEINNLNFIPKIVFVYDQHNNACVFVGFAVYDPHREGNIGDFYAYNIQDIGLYYKYMKDGFNMGKNNGFLVPVYSWSGGTYKCIAFE